MAVCEFSLFKQFNDFYRLEEIVRNLGQKEKAYMIFSKDIGKNYQKLEEYFEFMKNVFGPLIEENNKNYEILFSSNYYSKNLDSTHIAKIKSNQIVRFPGDSYENACIFFSWTLDQNLNEKISTGLQTPIREYVKFIAERKDGERLFLEDYDLRPDRTKINDWILDQILQKK